MKTSDRVREIAKLLTEYANVETSPVVREGHSVVPIKAIGDLERLADAIDDGTLDALRFE